MDVEWSVRSEVWVFRRAFLLFLSWSFTLLWTLLLHFNPVGWSQNAHRPCSLILGADLAVLSVWWRWNSPNLDTLVCLQQVSAILHCVCSIYWLHIWARCFHGSSYLVYNSTHFPSRSLWFFPDTSRYSITHQQSRSRHWSSWVCAEGSCCR